MLSNLVCFFSVFCTALAASSGTFNVLTFNVAGLPKKVSDNNLPGSKSGHAIFIGHRLMEGDYDIVHLQEDLNYHAMIYQGASFPYRTPTSGGIPFGSGLNSLSRYPWNKFKRVPWQRSPKSNTCRTPKGFTHMRIQIADGAEIDFYNVHADAGVRTIDRKLRADNFVQLSHYMAEKSGGRPVMLFGDTNDLYSRDSQSITNFKYTTDLQDAWVDLIRKGRAPERNSKIERCTNPAEDLSCEVVDKIFYRGNSTLQLKAIGFRYDGHRFLQPDGEIASDHNPVMVTMEWKIV